MSLIPTVDSITYLPPARTVQAIIAAVAASGIGVSGSAPYRYTQASPASTWSIVLPTSIPAFPQVTLYDATGAVVSADSAYSVSTHTLTVTFAQAAAGVAVLS
jgi:hypothetical protein